MVASRVTLDEVATRVVCESDDVESSGGGVADFWLSSALPLPYEGGGADLTRKYVDIGAAPEYAMWNGIRFGVHLGRVSETGAMQSVWDVDDIGDGETFIAMQSLQRHIDSEVMTLTTY